MDDSAFDVRKKSLFIFASWVKSQYGVPGLNSNIVEQFRSQQGRRGVHTKVYSTVLDVEVAESQRREAKAFGVTLIPATRGSNLDPKENPPKLEWLIEPEKHYPNLKDLRGVLHVVACDPMTTDAATIIQNKIFPHAELVRLKPQATGVLIVFDSWDINKCGLAHFHRSLFKNIQRKNRELLKFYATVLGDTISEEQQKDAEDAGITLIPRRRNDSIDPEQDPVGLHCLFYHKGYYPNLGDLKNIEYVIGYAPLTAAAAIDIRKSLFPEAQLYQINQLNPDSCHLMTDKGRSKLERDMVNFARQADAMVSIGPSMYDYFENAYRVVTEKTKPHIEILPDLGDDFSRQNIQLPEKVHHHMMLSYGVTFTGEREALAEYETVAGAVGRTATMMHDMRHPPPKWNIVGVSPNHYDTVQSKIEEKTNCSFLETRITAECSLVDLRDKLLTSHLCIIGQCQRQYGLYGLESIAAGLPTLISENTELGYLINKHFEDHAQWCVVRKSEDWFTTIKDALSQTRVTFKNADKLKKAYLESSEVKESHDRFSAMFKKSGPSQDLDVTITIDVQLWFHCFAEIEDAIDALSRQQSPNMSVIATLEAQLSECRYAFERCQRQLKRIADNLARDSSQLRMHIRQNEDLGINEVRGTKSGSLRMSVNFLGTLQLYKFKSGCRNGRLAAVLKPLLISDMMLKEALKVNIPLKLKVSYNTVQFDAIDKYFIYNQWSIASRSYEELSLKDTFNENDAHMQDHYKTATGDIWNTMAKMRRGPHFQRDIDEDVGRTRLSLRQRVFEVERDRLHITGHEFTNALYNIHEGEGWFIGGKEGSTKIMIKSSTDNKESNTFLRREIELMKELYSNENIDALVGCCTKTDPPYLITEYHSNGILSYFLTERHQDISSLGPVVMKERLLSFCLDIAKGMEYLSCKKIVHRYLAAKHIFVTDTMKCKISNLGYSQNVIGDAQFFELTEQFEISYQWMALESLRQRTFHSKSDVWSYGVVLWEIFSLGRMPYSHDTLGEVFRKLARGERLLKPDYCDQEMYRLMLSCWVTRHESRPSFGNIISSIPLMFTSKSVQKPSDHKHGHGYVEFSKRPFRKHFKVDRYIIRVTKEIYRGKYSHIYEGMARTQDDSDSVKNVAVKEVTDEASDKSSMQREIDLMKSIPAHENVIKLLAHSIKEGPPYFVTEFAQHGNLQQYLIKNRQHFIKGGTIESHRQLFSFAKDISCGMEHLSRIGVTHNYLAAKHVLVFTETTCKIANFGYASNVTHGKRTLSMEKKDTHPYQWMALETLTKWEFDTFTDVWAFGVVLWEIVTLGKKPFEGYQQRDVKWRISKGDRLYKPIHCSDEVYDVMLACWRKKPKDRPTFSKLVDITKRLRDRRDELLFFSKYK